MASVRSAPAKLKRKQLFISDKAAICKKKAESPNTTHAQLAV